MGECFENLLEYTLATPFLEAAMARRGRGIPSRQIFPSGTRAHDPENAIQEATASKARASFAVGAFGGNRDKGLDGLPLLVGEIHRLDSSCGIEPSLPFLR